MPRASSGKAAAVSPVLRSKRTGRRRLTSGTVAAIVDIVGTEAVKISIAAVVSSSHFDALHQRHYTWDRVERPVRDLLAFGRRKRLPYREQRGFHEVHITGRVIFVASGSP